MKYLLISLFLCTAIGFAQVKVSGVVVDEQNEPVPFANIIFVGSTEGAVSDENGKFYLESENTYSEVQVTFLGYEKEIVPITARNFNLTIVLKEDAASLSEVVVYSGKQKIKDNPAVAILRKIWAKKRQNGLRMYDRYEYDKYEKIEFDLNNIDEKFKKRRIFKGMEFIFEKVDTSNITGKAYLPIFINEALYKVHGQNRPAKRYKEELLANKNSGFESNQELIEFVKQLYVEYDIYDNYIKFFDKSFTSPISRTGNLVYNYVLADSAYIGNKWCYNIVYYPRRKNELTFKGDFWVNDTTFAITQIEMAASKSANINWIRDIYVEQDFEVVNDSVFLLKRDHIMSDFSLNDREKAKGVYGRRTTLFDNYRFDEPQDDDIYSRRVVEFREEIYNKSDDFWAENRMEKLNKDEVGIYKMLDTLKTVPRFKQLYNIGATLATGYWQIFDGFDYGPLFSSFGNNDVEGFRVRVGGRTYFGQNDPWRIEGYGAYGFKDERFKYGLSAKWLVDKTNRIILSAGKRDDIEQTGVSLTTANDPLSRSFASSAFFSRGENFRLTELDFANFAVDAEPIKNLNFRVGITHKSMKSAAPEQFTISYYDKKGYLINQIDQTEVDFAIRATPGRKTIGYGVEQSVSNEGRYPTIYGSYTRGFKGLFDSDLNFDKLQFYYQHRILLGGLGKLKYFVEAGKTFEPVPLTFLDVVPGNQALFSTARTFDLLDYYEFVTDEYVSVHAEHNFNGRLLARIPLLRKLNLREIVGARAVIGNLSDENIYINQFDLTGKAPTKPYWEYHFGIDNILKFIRIDFVFRGNYRKVPGATNFGIKGGFGFYF